MVKEIKSRTNEYFKRLKSLKQKKYRDEYGLYVVEGETVVREALEYGQPFECVVAGGQGAAIVHDAGQAGVDVVHMPYDMLAQIADTKTPPPVLAVLRKEEQSVPDADGLLIALDGVADPKNVGSIIRTADAMGAAGVLVSMGSGDIYGPKVQRAAMGSTFHLPVEGCELPARLAAFRQNGGYVIVSGLDGDGELPGLPGKVCVVIGNEARGVSDAICALADSVYRIPMYGRAESLNAAVAAGILMYEIRRRMG